MATIITTNDGSNTIYSEEFNDHYHSTFGAIQESKFIFIQNGLNFYDIDSLKVFEVGFGTGLNAILTFIESINRNINIEYHTIELYPIDIKTIEQLNYFDYLTEYQKKIYTEFHQCPWNELVKISDNFKFKKVKENFNDYTFDQEYDIVFFDAFAPEKQPLIWSEDNFKNIYDSISTNGILVTYSSKGLVKNNLRNAGFKVKRLDGPKG